MDKDTAQQLIKKTFENPFDKERFIFFIQNLLNLQRDQIEDKHPYSGQYIPDAYKQHISTLQRISKYQDSEGKEIDILIVCLKKEFSLEHARTMQRNFIAWYLNGSRGGKLKDAALVVFVAPNDKDWRFSLVKMEYKFDKTKTGRNRAKEELTPARRYSFLVGLHESSHTAQSRFAPILEDDVNNPILQQLEEAFNIERVGKEFFENYRDLLIWSKEELDEVFSTNEKIKAEFIRKNIDLVVFTKKLLGQIVFLYFLQKKGWLGANEKFRNGDRKFLRNLFERAKKNNQNFFNNYLEPLFYDALNNERRGSVDPSYYSNFGCKIPFLNGGLFEPLGNYNWKNTDINLPNELFSNDLKVKQGNIGTGILDIFDRFNFTVKEDEPLDREIAVDPELLGKLYEKFNAITSENFDKYLKIIKNGKKGEESKFNKQYGVYYTPVEIVQYMCRESIINYLLVEFEGKIDRIDIEYFINQAEQILENEQIVLTKKEQIKNGEIKESEYKLKTPNSIYKYAKEIDDVLANIKICDPAVGSGAFPIGMMNQIVTIRDILSILLKTNKTRYNLKLECIENSLYGVDIDLGAIEICKLRFWLSLVVEEEKLNIKPLPNLDYKVMQGDSLLEEYDGIQLFDQSLLYTQLPDEAEIENLKQHKNEMEKQLLEFYQQNPQWMNNKKIEKSEKLFALEKEHEKIILILKDKEKFKTQNSENPNLFGEEKKSKKIWEKLKELQHKYFSAFDELKLSIKEEIEDLTWELIEETLGENRQERKISDIQEIKESGRKPFFIWELNFPEVFANYNKHSGFDIVIANPPYIQLQKDGGKLANLYKDQNYQTFDRTGDIYCLFYEKGIELLRSNGVLTYISSNKWMRAGYGEKLRKFFTNYDPLLLIDLGANVFKYNNPDGPEVDTNILIIKKIDKQNNLVAADLKDEISKNCKEIIPNLEYYLKRKQVIITKLGKDAWFIGSGAEQQLKAKIERIGKSLIKWNVNIHYGIKTGLNEAFIITTEERNKILENCKTEDERRRTKVIIKPVLGGNNLVRYYHNWAGLWVIAIPAGWTNQNRGNKKPELFIEKIYSSLIKHLEQYETKAKKRNDQGDYWWELRHCVYYPEFEKEKVAWLGMNRKWKFSYVEDKIYVEASISFLVSKENIKYLLGILSSELILYYFKQIGSMRDKGGFMCKIDTVSKFPIPPITPTNQTIVSQIEILVDKILVAKQQNPKATTSEYENQIDQLVYKLYSLTENQIKIVENSNKKLK